jgi:MinD-like ATPase involved in chromosome partitioning or flagellar assembly
VRVLLVDLDFVSPSVAVLAANQDLPSLSTVLHHHQITSSFDETFLREFAPHFSGSSEGFRVVAGLSRPERWPEIKPQFLQRFFQSLSPLSLIHI